MSEKQYKRARKALWPMVSKLIEKGAPIPRNEFKRMVRMTVQHNRRIRS